MEEEDSIIKSPLDDRNYRYIKLPNELKALLISDQTTEKASAALSVRIGSLSDPDHIPGLAHFCEHMLFLGTEKYPSENEYTEYVVRNGGSFNACTSGEFTTFFFDVACDSLRGALDRFAQFFLSPLFNADASDREVNAVDSENEKNQQVDLWRFDQVCKATARPNHPYRKFMTGNKLTLQTRPRELGVHVREELLQFHSRHYSSNIMCLVVLGKESLGELAALVSELFSPIENKNVPVATFPEHPYSENEFQMRLEYVPVKDVRQLRVEFPLPDMTQYYDCDPSSYVAHLIGHEGQGSLLSYLRTAGWCNFLGAGASSGAKGFMFFCISVDLTEDGEAHVEDVLTAMFQYLAMLREEGPKEWIFQECANLDEIDFRFKDKEKPISYTQNLTGSLHDFPPKDILCAGLLRHYRPDLIEMVMKNLTSEFVRVGFLSQKFEGKTDLVEPWYGSAYSACKIDADLIAKWSSVELIPELSLPKPNEFIPTDFCIVPKPDGEMAKTPVLIQDTAMTKVWYKQDDTFFVPKASLCFKISSPEIYRSATSNAEITLFVNLLVDDLKEYAYDAEMAGIDYKISNDVYAVEVSLGGYHHKQGILLSKIMNRMSHFTVDQKRFGIFKEMLSRYLKNFRAEQPHTHAMYYCNVVLEDLVWTRQQMAEALEDVTCDMLQTFISNLFSHVHIEALMHGNLTKQNSLELVGIVEDALCSGAGAKPLPSPVQRHRQVILPEQSAAMLSLNNEVHNSCCIEFYLQVGAESTRSNVLLELLSQILQEPCFDTLRTKEQLGYIVVSGLKAANGVQGFRVLVQSMKPSNFVERRIELFLSKAYAILQSMEEDSFEGHKKALAVKRLDKPKKLKAETKKHWSEVRMGRYHFNRDKIEVACLMDLTKTDILTFYSDFISPAAPMRRKLTVHIVPSVPNHVPEPEEGSNERVNQTDGHQEEVDFSLPEATKITDISDFKSRLSFYPPPKPYVPT